jgi:hypothetical protein
LKGVEKNRAWRSLPRLGRVLFVLVALPVSACDAISEWAAGVDSENYTWEPMPGVKPKNTWDKDLRDCEAPNLEAAAADAGAAGGGRSMTRSEDSEVVSRCMEGKGYRKVYLQRTGWI